MREIKFRGKDVAGEWHHGLLTVLPKSVRMLQKGSYISNDAGLPFAYQVRPETVGQYTGLQDKNGREIYEGDIIESEEIAFNDSGSYEGMKRVCGSVVFMSGKFIFHKTTGALADVSTASIYNKVIGNIYENPKLIEV